MVVVTGAGSGRERLLLYGCAALVVAAVLAPLARAGYVLRYDMVFVPQQPLRWDLLAPGDAPPRAVPLDALVGLAGLAAPGWLLQRIALAAVLAGAALGAARLVPAGRTGTRLVAALAYAWTPFLAERLLLGQWGLLLGYAALPWLVRAALDVRRHRPAAGARLILAAACASVTPTGGIIALATAVAMLAGSARDRIRTPALLAAVAALNAPWLLAAAGTSAAARSDPAGVAAFAARSENWGGTLAALAGTGGIWNAQAVPATRAAPLVPVLTLGLLAAAAFGCGRLRRRWPAGAATRLAVLAGGGVLVAAAGTLPGGAGALRVAVVHLPGAGLLRDGQKFLIPYALGLALCVALGAERLADRLSARVSAGSGRLVLLGFALLPVAAMPDLAWGAGGRLQPVAYPADWDAVARAVAAAPGPVVALPMSAYRAFAWNDRAVVLDPAPRYLASPVLTDDRLRVGPAVIAGESRAAARVRARIAAGRPAADGRVRWVLVERAAGPAVPPTALAGLEEVHRGPALALYRNPRYRADDPAGPARRWPQAGHLLAALVVAGAAGWRLRNGPATGPSEKEDAP
ncbi:hypothetical protein [Actinoplanes sp. NPDC049118]|uniref:hypothetical protein n=1 Tax=Actinoplanes sp. NPDC049118 TaxID=3155769 RepID=UPI0033F1E817